MQRKRPRPHTHPCDVIGPRQLPESSIMQRTSPTLVSPIHHPSPPCACFSIKPPANPLSPPPGFSSYCSPTTPRHTLASNNPSNKHTNPSPITTAQTVTMPLVVPGINNESSGDKTEEWTNKLVGKKLHEEESNETTFCKRDLPEKTRVIEPGMMVTKDFVPNRLNVHIKEDGTVSHVHHG
ncbi:uncharacterized protein LY79DRAFT_558059 [Colletotrichum navitas]|uniref:Pua RNA binding domain-containing protein n=1 Tax=Colletotrichum navitas TaxID=681940 RepID=A0AAD8PX49_9PEZI|nr:uncharacterized protein LY79DRAFT_558059 [Colletotrichum navitas]KAK1585674.1 hypothetical protein LY79DRAFT_558059 [Colletotrichum navitas]